MNVYQHFRPEEHPFIDQVISWKTQVESNYAPKLTDFLDPREQQIVKLLIGSHDDTHVTFYGGSDNVERQRAFIYPDYYEPTEADFQIELLEVVYPAKFVTIEHRQILGSLMSLGLKRSKYGDILLNGDHIQFLVASEISDYVTMQLESIGRSKISLKKVPLQEAIVMREVSQEISTTVSSMRLDVVIAAVHNLSRQKAQNLITHGLVKVNWTAIENPSFECREEDIISSRGYGRVKIATIDGMTKKEKWRITVLKQN